MKCPHCGGEVPVNTIELDPSKMTTVTVAPAGAAVSIAPVAPPMKVVDTTCGPQLIPFTPMGL